ncbi:MAG: acyltransferase domain-containing protein [Bacteroidetes bacterium]|nr:acyltransferase domain-containing protein [Bacteroidota bacterium]
MAEDTLAFVFPAFIADYRDDPSGNMPEFRQIFLDYLGVAASVADPALLSFHAVSNPFLEDELRNQYLTYIYGCSCAETLRRSGIIPSVIAGYSMGIYAALYFSGSVSFETGLLFITTAYEAIRASLPNKHYGMCGVIGLSDKDIRELAGRNNLDLMIVNRNNDYSFILAGNSFHINVFLLKAREEGALHARSLGVTIPYHTNLLSEAARELSKTVYTADVRSPKIPVISVLRQDSIGDAERARTEVVKNIFNPFNWLETQQQIFNSGIHIFTECGPSLALKKNSKFIPGTGKFVSWDSLVSDDARFAST